MKQFQTAIMQFEHLYGHLEAIEWGRDGLAPQALSFYCLPMSSACTEPRSALANKVYMDCWGSQGRKERTSMSLSLKATDTLAPLLYFRQLSH